MIPLAYAALFGIPLLAALYVFLQRGSAHAVCHALVFGWLLMPLLQIEISGLPELQKETLLPPAIAFAAWISRRRTPSAIVPCWLDLPMLGVCSAPFVSSMTNGLGPINGVSEAFRATAYYGAPWLLGRLVLREPAGFVVLGRALLLGAAFYAPFCLLESRLAPQLHHWIYGLPGRVGWETVSFYGPLRFKASVFLQSPLELTPLMGIGAIFGWWLRRNVPGSGLDGMRGALLIAAATVAMLMGKSLGGFVLTVVGILVLAATRAWNHRIALVALMAVVPLYVATRASGAWDGMNFVEFVRDNISERRAESFLTRVENENLLVAKALERPVFGWAGWGRSRVYNEEGHDISITDGFWVIALGTTGWFGLLSWVLSLLLPVAMALARRWPRLRMRTLDAAALCALVPPLLHAVDCLANAMPNPFYYLLAGATVSYYQATREAVALGVPLLQRLSSRLGGRMLVPRPRAAASKPR